MNVTEMAVEHMSKEKGGKGGTIINIGSAAGTLCKHHLTNTHCSTPSAKKQFSNTRRPAIMFREHSVGVATLTINS